MQRIRTLAGAALFLSLGSTGAPAAAGQTTTPSTAVQMLAAAQESERDWWKNAVIYEIYPRSFQDTNGDGVGDLEGIIRRLDYLKDLDVDAIWLTPIYPSPQVDFGYDISDYQRVEPRFGAMADFDRLVAEAKKRHIRVIVDMVMNDTSDKHEWFLQSRSSRNNPYRDWYVWRDGIGETCLHSIGDLAKEYGTREKPEFQLPMDTQLGFTDKMDAATFRARLNDVETKIDGNTPLLVFDNHDSPRLDARYGDGVHNLDIQRAIAIVLFASRGAALFYYGDEIGMDTTPPARKIDVKAPIGITGWPKQKGRGGERTPMQWDIGPHAGFTAGDPWLPIPPAYTGVNVEVEKTNPYSLFAWYQRLIDFKKSNPAFAHGDNVMLDTANNSVLGWERKAPGAPPVVVSVNFTNTPQTVNLSGSRLPGKLALLLKTPGQPTPASLKQIQLKPFGVYIGELR